MEMLSLAKNKFADAGATALSDALHKVERLDLRDCNITSEGIRALADQLKNIPDKVRRETYSGKTFSGI